MPHLVYRMSFNRSFCLPASTCLPSSLPASQPTNLPTLQPTNLPTYQPTNLPTCQPTNLPTYQPTNLPTYQPTKVLFQFSTLIVIILLSLYFLLNLYNTAW